MQRDASTHLWIRPVFASLINLRIGGYVVNSVHNLLYRSNLLQVIHKWGKFSPQLSIWLPHNSGKITTMPK